MAQYRVVIADSSRQPLLRFIAIVARGRVRELRWAGEAHSRELAIKEATDTWIEHFDEQPPREGVVECVQLPEKCSICNGRKWLASEEDLAHQVLGASNRLACSECNDNTAIERRRFSQRSSTFAHEITNEI